MVSDWRGRRIVVGDVFLEEMPWDGSGGHDLDEDTMTTPPVQRAEFSIESYSFAQIPL